MFFSGTGPRSLSLEIEPPLDLPVGVVGGCKSLRAWRPPGGARGDIDAVAHQVAVAILDHVAEMDADPKFDALVGRDPDQRCARPSPLDFNGQVSLRRPRCETRQCFRPPCA